LCCNVSEERQLRNAHLLFSEVSCTSEAHSPAWLPNLAAPANRARAGNLARSPTGDQPDCVIGCIDPSVQSLLVRFDGSHRVALNEAEHAQMTYSVDEERRFPL
jgi:hypothetical protein